VLHSVPAILVGGLDSARLGWPLSSRGYRIRYANSYPFSSFVVVPRRDHELLVPQAIDGVEVGR